MFGLGVVELLIILVIIVFLFGGSRLPALGDGLARSIRNFRKQMSSPDEIDITPPKDDSKPTEESKAPGKES